MSTHTLIIWLWQESINDREEIWRGSASHVQSGYLRSFQTLDELYRQIDLFVNGDQNQLDCTKEAQDD